MQKDLIYFGDCADIFPSISSSSIDLILTDPPYNISRPNNFYTMGRTGIDFGEWDKDADLFFYLEEAFRVLKNGGSFIVFNDWKNLGDISKKSEEIGFETKDVLRFEKSNPMPRNRDRRYITDYEFAIWFVKGGAKWTFNRLDSNYQRPKFVCAIENGLHPTQKPIKLMEDIIKIHSNDGDLILDPFCGSGSTLFAAKNLNRNYIGIEKEEKYYNTAQQRLSV